MLEICHQDAPSAMLKTYVNNLDQLIEQILSRTSRLWWAYLLFLYCIAICLFVLNAPRSNHVLYCISHCNQMFFNDDFSAQNSLRVVTVILCIPFLYAYMLLFQKRRILFTASHLLMPLVSSCSLKSTHK